MRLLKIDIDSWSSPVARQYRVTSIPALWLFDGSEQVSTDTNQVLRTIDEGR